MVTLGKFESGKYEALPVGALLALGDRLYEFRGTTRFMTPQQETLIASQLMELRLSNIHVIGVTIENQKVRLQATANSVSLPALAAILPIIIWPLVALVFGIILFIRVPDWAIAAPFIATGGAILLYALYKAR